MLFLLTLQPAFSYHPVEVSANCFAIRDMIFDEEVGCENLMSTLRGVIQSPAADKGSRRRDSRKVDILRFPILYGTNSGGYL
jgi:hypothetical protein